MDAGSEALPAPLRCSEERLIDSGIFLLENGHSMFLWLGQASAPDFIQNLFNLPSLVHMQGLMVRITKLLLFHLVNMLLKSDILTSVVRYKIVLFLF